MMRYLFLSDPSLVSKVWRENPHHTIWRTERCSILISDGMEKGKLARD